MARPTSSGSANRRIGSCAARLARLAVASGPESFANCARHGSVHRSRCDGVDRFTTVNAVVADMAADYDLAPDWLNTNASAFVPENATWVDLEQLDGLTIQAADTETLLAMKIAAERDKDTLDIARLLRRLNITNAADAVDLAYDKYGEHSIPLAAGRDNYLIVVDDALDAATTLKPEPGV